MTIMSTLFDTYSSRLKIKRFKTKSKGFPMFWQARVVRSSDKDLTPTKTEGSL